MEWNIPWVNLETTRPIGVESSHLNVPVVIDLASILCIFFEALRAPNAKVTLEVVYTVIAEKRMIA